MVEARQGQHCPEIMNIVTHGPTTVLPSVACKLAWGSRGAEPMKMEAVWFQFQKLSSLQGTHIPIY